MKRSAFTRKEVIIVLAVAAVILIPAYKRYEPFRSRSNCQTNLKQIGLGIKQYVRDYDENYPIVNAGQPHWLSKKGDAGWMDIIQPYLKNNRLFQCPSESAGYVDGTTDYFYNKRMSGQVESKFEYIWNTIMLGDGAGNSPTNASVPQLPQSWTLGENYPSRRHKEGANYAFADGHVKWLEPAEISHKKANRLVNTFALW